MHCCHPIPISCDHHYNHLSLFYYYHITCWETSPVVLLFLSAVYLQWTWNGSCLDQWTAPPQRSSWDRWQSIPARSDKASPCCCAWSPACHTAPVQPCWSCADGGQGKQCIHHTMLIRCDSKYSYIASLFYRNTGNLKGKARVHACCCKDLKLENKQSVVNCDVAIRSFDTVSQATATVCSLLWPPAA